MSLEISRTVDDVSYIKPYNILEDSRTFYNILEDSRTFYNIIEDSRTF